jgi:hypothetical protein
MMIASLAYNVSYLISVPTKALASGVWKACCENREANGEILSFAG